VKERGKVVSMSQLAKVATQVLETFSSEFASVEAVLHGLFDVHVATHAKRKFGHVVHMRFYSRVQFCL